MTISRYLIPLTAIAMTGCETQTSEGTETTAKLSTAKKFWP